jgi:hypothetical protein
MDRLMTEQALALPNKSRSISLPSFLPIADCKLHFVSSATKTCRGKGSCRQEVTPALSAA